MTTRRAALAIALVVVVAAYVGLVFTRDTSRAPELPRKVPAPGLIVTRLYGRSTPTPVPLYGPGTVYGSFTEPAGNGGTGTSVFEGVYAGPDEIARFYRDRMLPAKPKYFEDEGDARGRTIHMLFIDGSRRLGVFIMTSAKGIARDASVWRGAYTGDRETARGDPRETMVLVSTILRPPG